MSSRRTSRRSLRVPRRQTASALDRTAGRPDTQTALPAKKTRGRRQPQAEYFQVTTELPQTLPILDKELRAIEILLGNELLGLFSNGTRDN